MLLFVTVNDHLTLALKSFTGQVERDGDREWKREGGREGADGKPIDYKRDRGGGKRNSQNTGWMDGRMEGGKKVCLCVRVCVCWRVFEREGG